MSTSIRHLTLTTLASTICALLFVPSCVEPPAAEHLGNVQLPLVTTTNNGDVYLLQNIVIDIVQDPRLVTTLVGIDDDLEQTTLSADLAAGDYTAQLAAGWQIAKRNPDGTTTLQNAILQGEAHQDFSVTNTSTTHLKYVFDIPGGTIVFGGTLEIGFQVRPGFPELSDKAPGPCANESDSDGDGLPDYREVFTYDEYGQKTASEVDLSADGVLDYATYFGYDEAGNIVKITADNNADGVIDIIVVSAYDVQGNRLQQRIDTNADGEFDRGENLEYDIEGNLVAIYKFDNPPFATAQYSTRYLWEYDEQGREVLHEVDDGFEVDQRETYTYSADGLVKIHEVDQDGNDTIDLTLTQTFDQNGNLLEDRFDYNSDGIVETREWYTYDAAGRLLTVKRDRDLDGILERSITYEYDAMGNVIRYTRAIDGSDTLTVVHEYDEHGNLLMTTNDTGQDGVIDYVLLPDYSCWAE